MGYSDSAFGKAREDSGGFTCGREVVQINSSDASPEAADVAALPERAVETIFRRIRMGLLAWWRKRQEKRKRFCYAQSQFDLALAEWQIACQAWDAARMRWDAARLKDDREAMKAAWDEEMRQFEIEMHWLDQQRSWQREMLACVD